MATIVVKRKAGKRYTGDEIAKSQWFDPERAENELYPDNSFWYGRAMSEPIDKMGYLLSALSTLAYESAFSRRKIKAGKLTARLANFERRMVNYVPHCTGIWRHIDWRWDDLPESIRRYCPKWDYGNKLESDEAKGLAAFMRDEGVDDFDFTVDSRYVIVKEAKDGLWENMKRAGLLKSSGKS